MLTAQPDENESVNTVIYHIPEVVKLRAALQATASDSERIHLLEEQHALTMERRNVSARRSRSHHCRDKFFQHSEQCILWRLQYEEAERERLEDLRYQRYRRYA